MNYFINYLPFKCTIFILRYYDQNEILNYFER